MSNNKRTDIHRVGAIIPADYEYYDSYDLGTSEEPPFNTQIFGEIERQGGVFVTVRDGKPSEAADHCDVCGARFRYGDVWKHIPSGEYLHLGHVCAAKYNLLANYANYDARYEAFKRAQAAQLTAAVNADRRVKFLAENDGLEIALNTDHDISRDLADKLKKYGALSAGQVGLAHKLYAQSYGPQKAPEVNIPAPLGKVTVQGIVVSVKAKEGPYGTVMKMTVKVTTPEGVWLCWGTAPDALFDHTYARTGSEPASPLKGQEVRFNATLSAGGEPHFAFFKRPTKAVRVALEVK